MVRRPPPWLVDRLIRNLLVDVTGNTHRAEICIDKLFSPEGPTGRLGLVEFRSFENAARCAHEPRQQLLLRAASSPGFWRGPLDGPMVRWGTALHDRLHAGAFRMGRILLERAGRTSAAKAIASIREWFDAQRQFRFPVYGEVTQAAVRLELRQALEPWYVLGEEGRRRAAPPASWIIPRSKRLQVNCKASTRRAMSSPATARRLPLTGTGRPRRIRRGVRFKAWSLPAALHPTVGRLQAPLTFDILDSWSLPVARRVRVRRLPPGGRHYETYPVNIVTRRKQGGGARFQDSRGTRRDLSQRFRRRMSRWSIRSRWICGGWKES